jgi:branched-chain amino acid transport system permease protein
MVLQTIWNALVLSSLYALIAIGFTLIFGVGKDFNFAHGAFITTGAFAGFVVSNPQWLGRSPWLGIVASILVGAALGGVVYAGFVHHLDNQVAVLIVTLVIGFLLEHSYRIFISGGVESTISIAQPISGRVALFGFDMQLFRGFVLLASWGIIVGTFLFIDRTRIGRAILATSMNRTGARLVGIDGFRVTLLTWILAAAAASFSGVLLTMLSTGSWNMGTDVLILSFAIIILGGLGSIKGSVVGAYIIGFTDVFTVEFVNPRLEGVSALILLVVFLLVRPEGLFGQEVVSFDR